MKRQTLDLFYRGVYAAGKFSRGRAGVTILSYHSIDDYGTPLSVPPGLFEEHMAALAEEGCTTLTMEQVGRHLRARRRFPRRSVAITFDDGLANLATVAAPVLARHDFRATVYIITGMVGRTTRWTDRGAQLPSLPLLTWEQIRALRDQGVEIGAHSITHGFLTRCGDEELGRELAGSREALERELGAPVLAFAYPQGDYNRRVVEATRAAGYTTATTVDQGRATLSSDPLRLPRLLVSGNTTPERLRAFCSPAIGPAYTLLNFAMKRLLRRPRWPRRYPGEVDSTGFV